MLPQLFFRSNETNAGGRIPGISKQLRRCALSGTADQSVKNRHGPAYRGNFLSSAAGAVGSERGLLRKGRSAGKTSVSRGGRVLYSGAECHGTGCISGCAAGRKSSGFMCGTGGQKYTDCGSDAGKRAPCQQ